MAGDFYTLGEIRRSELKVMAFPPRQKNKIKNHNKRKSLLQMVLVSISVIAPFVGLVVLSDYAFRFPILYLILVMVATSYFTLFIVSNRHFFRR